MVTKKSTPRFLLWRFALFSLSKRLLLPFPLFEFPHPISLHLISASSNFLSFFKLLFSPCLIFPSYIFSSHFPLALFPLIRFSFQSLLLCPIVSPSCSIAPNPPPRTLHFYCLLVNTSRPLAWLLYCTLVCFIKQNSPGRWWKRIRWSWREGSSRSSMGRLA